MTTIRRSAAVVAGPVLAAPGGQLGRRPAPVAIDHAKGTFVDASGRHDRSGPCSARIGHGDVRVNVAGQRPDARAPRHPHPRGRRLHARPSPPPAATTTRSPTSTASTTRTGPRRRPAEPGRRRRRPGPPGCDDRPGHRHDGPATLFDADGSAFIIHANPDDQVTNAATAAAARGSPARSSSDRDDVSSSACRGSAMNQELSGFGRFAEPSLYILVSLSDGPKHGYAIMTDVEAISGLPLGPGTLYAALARLEQRGLIEALEPVDRRRPYRLTGAGRHDARSAARRAGRVRPDRPRAAQGRRAMTTLLSLYPRAWRERYEDEFMALLEARPPDARDRIDIIRGAHRCPAPSRVPTSAARSSHRCVPYDGPWTVRRAGPVTLIGGSCTSLTIVARHQRADRPGRAATPIAMAPPGSRRCSCPSCCCFSAHGPSSATLPSPSSRRAVRGRPSRAIAGLLWAAAPWMSSFGAVLCLRHRGPGRRSRPDPSLALVGRRDPGRRGRRRSGSSPLVAGIRSAVDVAADRTTPDIQYVMLLLLVAAVVLDGARAASSGHPGRRSDRPVAPVA